MKPVLLGNVSELSEEFEQIAREYAHDDSQREQVITTARGIIKPAKQAIYATHRGDLDEAQSLLDQAKSAIVKAHELMEDSQLQGVGAFRASLEEYVEAVAYLQFSKEQTILLRKDLDLPFSIPYEIYLAALCDFSGELVRKAVLHATEKEKHEVDTIGQAIAKLLELFMSIDFRSGELRKKMDAIKYNLAKVQDIKYDLSLHK